MSVHCSSPAAAPPLQVQLVTIRTLVLQKCQLPQYASSKFCGLLPTWSKMLEKEVRLVESAHQVSSYQPSVTSEPFRMILQLLCVVYGGMSHLADPNRFTYHQG
jgi:hypothetical protein